MWQKTWISDIHSGSPCEFSATASHLDGLPLVKFVLEEFGERAILLGNDPL
jgi:hypothetical protein